MVKRVKATTQQTRAAESVDSGGSRFAFGFRRPVADEYTDVEIYYGTMFGGAERYARALCHSIQTNCRVHVSVQDLDGFDESHFARRDRLTKSRLFVFVASTHFAGAPSPSAERFCGWLRSLGENVSTTSSFSVKEARKVPKGQLPMSSKASSGFLARLSQLLFRRKVGIFDGMQYAVFGLGDSQYLTYNFVGKFLDAKLKQLGGTPVVRLGLGDASNNDEASYRKWEAAVLLSLPGKSGMLRRRMSFESLRSTVTNGRQLSKAYSKMQLLPPRTVAPATRKPPDTEATIKPDCSVDKAPPSNPTELPRRRNRPSVTDNFGRHVRLRHLCRLITSDPSSSSFSALERPESRTPSPVPPESTAQPRTPRIALFDSKPFAVILPIELVGSTPSAAYSTTQRRGHRQDPPSRSAIFCVRLMNREATYSTVSTLGMFPQNSPDTVSQVADAFGYDLDAVIQLSLEQHEHHAEQHQLPFPTPCTIRTALTEFLELRTVTREFVRISAGFVATTDEREQLDNLASTAGSAAFRAEFQEQHKGILDLVAMAPSLQLPLEVFVNIVPTIKPRYFTIGSSPSVSPRDLHLAISLARAGHTPGLAAEYFERLLHSSPPTGVPIRGFISYSRFQFHDDGVFPLILIAAGTGLSPMRAILQERLVRWIEHRSMTNATISMVPKHLVFYGCSNEDSIVYRDDLRRWEQQLFIRVHYSFSNDAHHPPRYVQDTLAARIDEIVQLVGESSNARICVCGRSPMARAVREVFEKDQTLRRHQWFDTIRTDGRYIEEAHH